MKFYHGTVARFNYLDLAFARTNKDFGRGIYLSNSFEMASRTAIWRSNNLKVPCIVMEYEVNEKCFSKLGFSIKRFKTPSVSWVKYIIKNRTSSNNKFDYDIVIGPTADAYAQSEINKFISCFGNSPTESDYKKLISLLNPKKYKTQICLKSERAVNLFNINYKGSSLVNGTRF